MATPTPPPGSDPGADVTQVPRTGGERFKSAIGGILDAGGGRAPGSSRLEQEVAKHYGARLDEAKMHRRNATTYAGVLASGINPQTGEPLTDEERQQYQNWYNASWAAYQKIAGVSKETKGALAKGKTILEHIIGIGSRQQQPGAVPAGAGATPPASAAGATPPPTSSSSQSAPQGAPKQMTPPPQSDLDAASLNAPQAAAGLKRQQDFQDWSRQEDVLHKHKMEEAQARPHHMQLKNFKRPGSQEVESGSYDPSDGKFYDQAGNVVDGATAVPQSASTAKRFLYLDKQGNPRFGIQEGENLYDMEHNLLPPDTEPLMRGLIGTETVSKDQFGNVTVSIRKPMVPGVGGAGAAPGTHGGAGPSATPKSPQAPPGAPAAPGRTKTSSPGAGAAAAPGSAATPGTRGGGGNPYAEWGLSADGTIPASAGGNDQVRELAQQLLDGQDINKLPAKGRTPAGELARRYGWEQGKFTPKEQVMLREATTFLEQAVDDDSLKALDEGFFARMKTGQTSMVPDKEGYIGRSLTTLAAQHLSEREANFIEMYNQLVGTISGLAQLVRSGRATEATIDRLKAELPNPFTTKDSKHAKSRLQRLIKEVNVAMEKGTFIGPAKKPGTMTPPPAASANTKRPEAQKPIYASAPGKPRMESTDGGKTWHKAPSVQ